MTASRNRLWQARQALRAAVLASAAWAGAAASMDMPVDLELVLAVDISGSMDMEEQALQRQGYVEALTHPEVLSAIRQGIYGRIAVAYVEWAGVVPPSLTLPFTLVAGPDDARALAAALADAPLQRYRGTSIAQALLFSAPLFDGNGFEGLRRTIDVSGDGPNNMGPPILPARDAVLAQGITVNGLPIMLRTGGYGAIPDLDRYYADCVIGGPGSFVIPVTSLDQFPDAIRRKLLLEIAGRPASLVPVQLGLPDPAICMVGEQQRRFFEMDR